MIHPQMQCVNKQIQQMNKLCELIWKDLHDTLLGFLIVLLDLMLT